MNSNFLDLEGGTMVGDVSMDDNDITNLPDTPPTDNSVVCKKYVDNEIGKITGSGGGPSTSGFTMTGDINMGRNEVNNLPDTPSRDHSAVSKKYVTDNFCDTSGDTMTGNLNLGGHEIINLQSWTKVVVTPTPSLRIQCCHVESQFNIDLGGGGVLQHFCPRLSDIRFP